MKYYIRYILTKLFIWRMSHVRRGRYFLYGASVAVGLVAALAAIVMKNAAHHLQNGLHNLEAQQQYLYILYPLVGLVLVAAVVRFVLKKPVGHGIPKVLFAIARKDAKLSTESLYSSWIASVLTVGFGGSVGLEGPAATTGASIGSNIGQGLRLGYKQTLLLLACGATSAIAAIFNTPIAAIIFSLEVLMIDLSISSMIPLLLASVTGISVSYFFLGQETLWAFNRDARFELGDLPMYLCLGLLTGLVSVYFTKVYIQLEDWGERIRNNYLRILAGGAALGAIVLVLPYLYGEGYGVINECLHGNTDFLFDVAIYQSFPDHPAVIILLLLLLILLKPIASSLTFGAGGVGGIFAPSLFVGAVSGLLFAYLVNLSNAFGTIHLSRFALVGMAGVMTGVLHGPLTAIFLIADITGGYGFIVPIMAVSSVSFATTRYFVNNSVYTHELAKRNQLLTHNKDKSVLDLMQIGQLLETDFSKLKPDQTLRDLVKQITLSKRDIFPVVDEEERLLGIITLNDVKHLIFDQEKYDKLEVSRLMHLPEITVEITDTAETLTRYFHETGKYNLPVIDQGRYLGFVSRANVFATYQKLLRQHSPSSTHG